MHQVRAARPGTVGQVRVDADQNEGRRDDAGADAQALPEALGEGGLPRPQLAGEDQQVPGLELGTEAGREGVGLIRGPDVQGPFPGRRAHGRDSSLAGSSLM